ncbi:MAG: hypothetical protein ACPLKS_04760 [Caldisericum exile]|uniref:hypothetical protein n=1 Tax=Caldisericum exile TaxID=693075 RepID=UPI003C71FA9D
MENLLQIKYVDPIIKYVKRKHGITCKVCYKAMDENEPYVYFRTRNRDLIQQLKLKGKLVRVSVCIRCWKKYRYKIEQLLGNGYEELSWDEIERVDEDE